MAQEKMNTTEFKARFGFAPIQDDLDRVNCPLAGLPLHQRCGICTEHNKPRFQCSCVAPTRRAFMAEPTVQTHDGELG